MAAGASDAYMIPTRKKTEKSAIINPRAYRITARQWFVLSLGDALEGLLWGFVMRLWPCPISNGYITAYALPAAINVCGFPPDFAPCVEQREHQNSTGNVLGGDFVHFLMF